VWKNLPGKWEVRVNAGKVAPGKWKTVTTTVQGTREDAEAELDRLRQAHRGGIDIKPSKQTVAEYFEQWLEGMKTQISPRSHERYTELVDQHIVPLLGATTKLKALRKEHITGAYAKAFTSGRLDGKGGLSAATVVYIHRITKQALMHAGLWPREWDGKRGIRPPKPERKPMTVYNADQTANLIELARSTSLLVPMLIAATTGMRRGEIAALRWRNVDLDKAQLSVEQSAEQTKAGVRYKPLKNGKGRTVALPAIVVEELRAHRIRQAEDLLRLGVRLSDESFVVAQADGSPYQPRSLTHAVAQFRARHKLPRIWLHALRHTHATAMLKARIHPKIAQERLGHSSIQITLDLYSHVIEGMQEEAAAAVDDALGEALNRRRNVQ